MWSIIMAIIGKQALIDLALGLLKLAYGRISADAIALIKEAQLHTAWTNEQKFDYVWKSLLAKYDKLADYKWVVEFIINSLLAKVKDKSATIVKAVS